MNMSEVIKRDSHLAFYVYNIKPWMDKTLFKDKISWNEIEEHFPGKFGKSGARKWFYAIIYRYSKEFKDLDQTKKNLYYNKDIAKTLMDRYIALDAVSKKKVQAVKNTPAFSEDEAAEILKLL